MQLSGQNKRSLFDQDDDTRPIKRLRTERGEQPVGRKKLGKYAQLIQHPTRVLCCGRSQMGKTTLAVQVIQERFADMDRYIVICPSWDQTTYDPIRSWFDPRDVYKNPQKHTFDKIVRDIDDFNAYAKAKGMRKPKTFILFDDMAGTHTIHSNGKGAFPNFAIQVTHKGASLMVISQDPIRVDPDFRSNSENFIVFPSESKRGVDWLNDLFNSPIFGKSHNFYDILNFAWTRGEGRKEIGKHFMFVHSAPRTYTRFYCDFDREVKSTQDK